MMEAIESQIQAFKLLHGLQTLPTSGKKALELWVPFSQCLLSTVRLTPHLEQLAESYKNQSHQHTFSSSKHKEHFIDLSTGIRLHYLSWPHTSDDDVVLLLHDIAHCSNTWIEVGTKLYDRGYTVFALDLRGHGGTSSSSSNNYTASNLAEDVNAFIIAKDLYIRPVSVVGCGIGGVVALTLANKAPNLIGAVACLDFGLPPPVATSVDNFSHSSAEMLPWWSFWLGQGLKFQSSGQCAAFLMSPLTQVGPAVFSNILSSTTKEEAQGIKHIIDRLTRPPHAAAQDAVSMLRPATSIKKSIKEESFIDDFDQEFEANMDPTFFFTFNIDALKRGITALKAHLLVVHGENSAMVPPDDAATLARLAELTAASVTTVQIPQTGHYLVQDAPNDVYNAIVQFLEGPAVSCFNIEGPHTSSGTGNNKNDDKKNSRRPELLGIRPLPEYSTLEEAKKALGPRTIPTAEAIEEELRKLRLEERGTTAGASTPLSSSDEDEGEADGSRRAERKRKTALSHDPSDYFGFVG